MKTLLGKKIGMTQIFAEDGTVIPVTVIEAGPETVVQMLLGTQYQNVGLDSHALQFLNTMLSRFCLQLTRCFQIGYISTRIPESSSSRELTRD